MQKGVENVLAWMEAGMRASGSGWCGFGRGRGVDVGLVWVAGRLEMAGCACGCQGAEGWHSVSCGTCASVGGADQGLRLAGQLLGVGDAVQTGRRAHLDGGSRAGQRVGCVLIVFTLDMWA